MDGGCEGEGEEVLVDGGGGVSLASIFCKLVIDGLGAGSVCCLLDDGAVCTFMVDVLDEASREREAERLLFLVGGW